ISMQFGETASYDGSATKDDDGGVGDEESNYGNCLDDGGRLEGQQGTKIATLIPNDRTPQNSIAGLIVEGDQPP
ncbi:hypothetical protein GW17_00035931, partial [Ensete ventricosum]